MALGVRIDAKPFTVTLAEDWDGTVAKMFLAYKQQTVLSRKLLLQMGKSAETAHWLSVERAMVDLHEYRPLGK